MRLLLIPIIAIMLTACDGNASKEKYTTIDGFAEGTTYHIVYQDAKRRDLTPEITTFFERFDKSLSIYDSTSMVSKINAGDSSILVDDWFTECFALSQDISRRSDGLFDITLRPLIAAYGFGGKDGMKSISQSQIDSMLTFVGYDKVTIKDNRVVRQDIRTELDFNAVAKGYSVDLLGQMIEQLGIENYLVEVGGEIVCKGVNPKGTQWVVAIDTPFEGNYAPGADTKAIISISGYGLATSGNYRKFKVNDAGEPVVHTIDPRTGKPSIHNLLSATILAPTCGEADGFATACMVAGLDGAKKIVADSSDLEALFIYAEGKEMKIYATDKMQKRILDAN